MITCKLHIVALPFYEVGGCLSEFYAEAPGKAMTLRPDPANDWDLHAICAYDWEGRHVGYVPQREHSKAWFTLRNSNSRWLRGHISEVDTEHKSVTFECSVEQLGEVTDLYSQSPFMEWAYTGPVLKLTREMVTLDYMMDEICQRLSERTSWSVAEQEDFTALCKRFCKLSKYDLSGDMSDYRRRLSERLQETKDEGLLPLVKELNMTSARCGRETHEGDVLDYWMGVLSEPKMVRSLLVRRQEYDLEKLRRQLEAFPESMFDEWLVNREHFVSKLVYMHIPREVLWRLVSGIAFYEAMTAINKVREEGLHKQEKTQVISPVFLGKAKGQKIDVIRVLNVMYEMGMFKGTDGEKLTKKDFFITMGKAMNVDLSDYDKHLSRSMADSTKLDKHMRVFEEMSQTMMDLWNSR